MMIMGECIANVQFRHDGEGDAIREAPFFIAGTEITNSSAFQKGLGSWDDLNGFGRSEPGKNVECLSTQLYRMIVEKIQDFDNNQIAGNDRCVTQQ